MVLRFKVMQQNYILTEGVSKRLFAVAFSFVSENQNIGGLNQQI